MNETIRNGGGRNRFHWLFPPFCAFLPLKAFLIKVYDNNVFFFLFFCFVCVFFVCFGITFVIMLSKNIQPLKKLKKVRFQSRQYTELHLKK